MSEAPVAERPTPIELRADAPECFEPVDGIYTCPMPMYLGWPFWSSSMLSLWRERTPAFAKWALTEKHADESSLAKTLGTVTHAAVLEPDTFEDLFVPEPEPDREKYRTASGGYAANVRSVKSFKDAVAELAETGKTVVRRDVYDDAIAMRDALRAHPGARALLDAPGHFETSVVVTDPTTGVRLKCRPDKLVVAPFFINANLKTTANAHRDSFSVDLFRFRYFVDFAFYARALGAFFGEPVRSAAITVDTTGPKDDRVAVHELDAGTLDAGHELVEKYLVEIATCIERDKWPGHPTESRMISLPPWAWRRVDDELAEIRDVFVGGPS